MRLDLNNEKEVKRFNEFLNNSRYARFPQSIEWTKVKNNWDHEIVYIEEEGKIVAGIVILIKKIMGFSLFYAQEGPICDLTDYDLVKKLMDEVEKVAKERNAFVLAFDPDFKVDTDVRDKYISMGYKVTSDKDDYKQSSIMQPIYTFELALKDKSEEELLKSFNSKTRYNIRLSKRKGVNIEYGRDESLVKRFYELHKMTCERSKIAIRDYSYYKNMVDVMGDKIRVYIASHEGDDLFGAICISSGIETFYVYGGSSDIKRNFMASELTMFEMIKWGVENKAEKFNFGGFMHLDKNSGLYRFKVKFTGEEGLVRKIGLIEKPYKPFMYFMYKHILPLRNNLKNILNGSGLE